MKPLFHSPAPHKQISAFRKWRQEDLWLKVLVRLAWVVGDPATHTHKHRRKSVLSNRRPTVQTVQVN